MSEFDQQFAEISTGNVTLQLPTLETNNVFSIQGVQYTGFTTTSTNFPIKKAQEETETNIEFLFVKFEGASVSEGLGEHILNLGKRHTGTQLRTQYKTRREDDRGDYDPLFKDIDINFYNKYCSQDIPILEWYNQNVRTGLEFFVSRGLLTKFLTSFLFTPPLICSTPELSSPIPKPIAAPSQLPPKKSLISSATEGYNGFNKQFQGMKLNYGGKKRKANKKTKKNRKSRKSRKSRKHY